MVRTTLDQQLRGLTENVTPAKRAKTLDALSLGDQFSDVETPIGLMTVAFNSHGVSMLARSSDADNFARQFSDRFSNRPLKFASQPPEDLMTALRTGRGRSLKVDLRTLSEFQREVLTATRGIPVGEVRSYQWVAQRINRPKAVRAVGTALGANPVPLIIPCHRVIRSDGSVGQYLFGTEAKQNLLAEEGANGCSPCPSREPILAIS